MNGEKTLCLCAFVREMVLMVLFNDTLNPRSDPQMTQMDTDDKAGTDYAGLLSNGSEWVSKM